MFRSLNIREMLQSYARFSAKVRHRYLNHTTFTEKPANIPPTPANHYRYYAKSVTVGVSATDDQLLAWAEKARETYPSNRGEFFMAAVIFLSFGQIEAYQDVLQWRNPNFYLGNFYSNKLAEIAADIFPLPFATFCSSPSISDEDARNITLWVETNKQILLWSEEAGVFLLTTES